MFILLRFMKCAEFLIKLQNAEKYLQTVSNLSAPVFFGPKETGSLFYIKRSPDHILQSSIFIKNAPNQVLDLSIVANKLISYPFYGTSNQRAVLRMDGPFYRIEMGNKCLTYHDGLNYVDAQECSQKNSNQRFTLIHTRFEPENDSEDEGFYTENVMASLVKIKQMANDIRMCFGNNGTCTPIEKPCISIYDKGYLDSDGNYQTESESEENIGSAYTGEIGLGSYNQINAYDGSSVDYASDKLNLSYTTHGEKLRHDESLEREMEADFNRQSEKLSEMIKEYASSAFSFLQNEKSESKKDETIEELQKLRQLPTYADLFSGTQYKANLEAAQKKAATKVHEKTTEVLSSINDRIKQNENAHSEEKHSQSIQDEEITATESTMSDEYHKAEDEFSEIHENQKREEEMHKSEKEFGELHSQSNEDSLRKQELYDLLSETGHQQNTTSQVQSADSNHKESDLDDTTAKMSKQLTQSLHDVQSSLLAAVGLNNLQLGAKTNASQGSHSKAIEIAKEHSTKTVKGDRKVKSAMKAASNVKESSDSVKNNMMESQKKKKSSASSSMNAEKGSKFAKSAIKKSESQK